jgi:FkbM family methyltransferase
MSDAQQFRTRSLLERLADAVPRGGPFAGVRRRLKPWFERRMAASGGGLLCELPGGETIRIDSAYRHITWNPIELEAFRAAVRPGDVVIEAGANVGAYTVAFGKWVGTTGRVIAFEPDPTACAGLRRHVALNNLEPVVTVVPAAMTDGAQPTVKFAIFGASGISRVADGGASGSASVRDVEAVSLDGYCAAHGLAPAVVKVDVEGAELGVLRGGRRVLAATASARTQLFVEMHPALWPAIGVSAADIRTECERLGREIEPLAGVAGDPLAAEGICLRLRPRA